MFFDKIGLNKTRKYPFKNVFYVKLMQSVKIEFAFQQWPKKNAKWHYFRKFSFKNNWTTNKIDIFEALNIKIIK